MLTTSSLLNVPILVVNSCRAVARGGAEGAFTDCSNFHLGVFDDSTFSGILAYEISFMYQSDCCSVWPQ